MLFALGDLSLRHVQRAAAHTVIVCDVGLCVRDGFSAGQESVRGSECVTAPAV